MINETFKLDIRTPIREIYAYDEECQTLSNLRSQLDEIERVAIEKGFSVVSVRINGEIEFYNIRKETDEELKERLNRKEEQEKYYKEERHKQFLRLKKEFEPTT